MAEKYQSDEKKPRKVAEAEALALITQTARSVRTALSRQLLDAGLYAGQDSVILALERTDGVSPGAIAASLGVKAPTITKTIGRLGAQGFLRTEKSDRDARMVRIFLTDAGREKIMAVRAAQRVTEKQAFDSLRGKDIRRLIELLSEVDEAVSGNRPESERAIDGEDDDQAFVKADMLLDDDA